MVWIVLLVAWTGWGVWRYRRDLAGAGPVVARRRLFWRVTILLVLYGAILTMLLQLENRFIYFPASAREYWQPPPGLRHEDVTLRSGNGDSIHAWWCPQEGATFTILFSHGNAGNLSGHAWIIPAMRDAFKANVLIYDYPGYGKSGGTPSESGCYAAADAAYEWLTKIKGVPTEKIVLMGQSLGASMACELASKRPHRALVLLSPFTSAGDMAHEIFPIFPTKWLMVHRYDNLAKVKNYRQPILIGHAAHDSIIPFGHGKRLFDACPSPAKTFHEIPQGDHNDLDRRYFEAVGTFLQGLK
jgi:pimeloyl-ACP methyl ester carboxylesterase